MKFKIRKYYLNERNHKKREPDFQISRKSNKKFLDIFNNNR